ncbi:MAG: hypothetical protein OXG19_02650 [Chloroflexi bacterium]|nr:hypothetical protein [Chloroflexota bacterium]
MPVRRTRRSQRFLLVCVPALLLASGLAACNGSTDDELPPAATETASQTAVPAASPPAETPPSPTTPEAPVPEPPATPIEPPAPEASPPTDEPASTATATPEPAAEPVESPTGAPSAATDEAEVMLLLYDTYDLSGAVAEPGHYAFLADPGDPSSAVTTYEGLRDGTATRLRLHPSDADGADRSDLLAILRPGDLVEWHKAADCFVRYQVTAGPDAAAPTAYREIGVAWMTYAFTGCSGAIPAGTGASVGVGDLPNLGGTSLTAPIRHGPWQILPEGWTGATEETVFLPVPTPPDVYTEDIAVARQFPNWREPILPDGWTFIDAHRSGEVASGYSASWTGTGRGVGLVIRNYLNGGHGGKSDAVWRLDAGRELAVVETRVIAGRPAWVRFGVPNPTIDRWFSVSVRVEDPETDSSYYLFGGNVIYRGANVDALVDVAASLFADGTTP